MSEVLQDRGAKTVRLNMSQHEYNTLRHGRNELKISGLMFDVRSVSKKDGMLHVVAIRDADEEAIIAGIEQALHHLPGDKEMSDDLITLLSLEYIGIQSESSMPVFFESNPILFGPCSYSVLDADNVHILPPPWCGVA